MMNFDWSTSTTPGGRIGPGGPVATNACRALPGKPISASTTTDCSGCAARRRRRRRGHPDRTWRQNASSEFDCARRRPSTGLDKTRRTRVSARCSQPSGRAAGPDRRSPQTMSRRTTTHRPMCSSWMVGGARQQTPTSTSLVTTAVADDEAVGFAAENWACSGRAVNPNPEINRRGAEEDPRCAQGR